MPKTECDRPGCSKQPTEDYLYCSDACYRLDNDDTPITVLARNKAGGFGRDLHWSIPTPVHAPYRVCFIKRTRKDQS